VPDDLVLASARLALGLHYGARVDLEAGGGMRADISGREDGFDITRLAGDKAAAFVRLCPACLGQKGFGDPACNPDDHYDMN
jgi:hypothetical protein